MYRMLAIGLCLLVSKWSLAAAPTQQLQLLIAQKQFAAAAKAGEELLQQGASQPRARFLTAYAYQMAGQKKKAVALYRELIDANPSLPEPRNNLAMIYLDQGDYDRASQLLVEAINTHSSYATAYRNLSRIYKGIASEAYRRAVSESSEPAKHRHSIELTAITRLAPIAGEAVDDDGPGEPSAVQFANRETLLIEKVRLWASAWSDKDFSAYTAFYSPQHKAGFDSHEQWLAHRRERILRPGQIRVDVSDIRIKWRSENRAIVDFRQDFGSPSYSDRVIKRLAFSHDGSQWKITEERVLSVL